MVIVLKVATALWQAAVTPINIIPPDYGNVAIGEIGSLEGDVERRRGLDRETGAGRSCSEIATHAKTVRCRHQSGAADAGRQPGSGGAVVLRCARHRFPHWASHRAQEHDVPVQTLGELGVRVHSGVARARVGRCSRTRALLRGWSNWYKGVQLMLAYAMIAILFYFLPVAGH
jgi:hypothetical protein